MAQFREVKPLHLAENAFNLIGDEWMLVGAAKPDGTFNMMTASWGMMGIMWGKPALNCLVRNTRYTFEFTEASNRAAFSFFGTSCRKQLNRLGSKSGREIDKMHDSGLTPIIEDGAVWFGEARLVFIGNKLYAHDVVPDEFKVPILCDTVYAKKDFHRIYTYEIEKILIRER